MAQTVKNPRVKGDVSSIFELGRPSPPNPEKEMATHTSIPAWRIPWTERSLAGYDSPWGHRVLDTTVQARTHNSGKMPPALHLLPPAWESVICYFCLFVLNLYWSQGLPFVSHKRNESQVQFRREMKRMGQVVTGWEAGWGRAAENIGQFL